MKKYLKNWKTTSAGIVAMVTAVVMYTQDKTKIVEAVTLFLTGIGLVFASDVMDDPNDVTPEPPVQ